MFCPKCGASGQTGVSCSRCAAPLPVPMAMAAHPVVAKTSGLAIAGFVLAFFCSVLGIICSLLALDEIKKSEGRIGGDGLARAGLWLSIIFLLLGVVLVGGR